MTVKTIQVGDFDLVQREVNEFGVFELYDIFNAPIFGYRKVNPETAKIVMHMFNFADETPTREGHDVDTLRALISAKLEVWTGGTPSTHFNPPMQQFSQYGSTTGYLLGRVFAGKARTCVSATETDEFIITIGLPHGFIEIGNGGPTAPKMGRGQGMITRNIENDPGGVVKFQVTIDGAVHSGKLHYAVPVCLPAGKPHRKEIELQIAEVITSMNGAFGKSFKLPVTDVKLV